MRRIVFGIIILTSFLLAGFFGEASSNVSGEAFLRTKGGSVITCAGSPVYIEKYNDNGYAYLTELITTKEKKLFALDAYRTINKQRRSVKLKDLEYKFRSSETQSRGGIDEKIVYWKKRLSNSSTDGSKNFIKEQLEELKKVKSGIAKKENAKMLKKLKEENVKVELEETRKIYALEKEILENKKQRSKSIREDTQETICNSQGQFSFLGLIPDKYYINTTVEWFAGDEKQGGIVSKIVTLKKGENQIFITN